MDQKLRIKIIELHVAGYAIDKISYKTGCSFAEANRIISEFEQKAEPGEGYRILEIGEYYNPGDEVLCGNGTTKEPYTWSPITGHPITNHGCRISPETIIRRKVGAPGHRKLSVGEITQKGDEFFVEPADEWIQIPSSWEGIKHEDTHFETRRKVVEPSWVNDMMDKLEAAFCTKSPGTKIAEEMRAECNKSTKEQARDAIKHAMSVISAPTEKLEPIPAEGYRWLEFEESFREGDEILRNGKWEVIQGPIDYGLPYVKNGLRRKVSSDPNPGKGYRWVRPGEQLLPHDEEMTKIELGVSGPVSELPKMCVAMAKATAKEYKELTSWYYSEEFKEFTQHQQRIIKAQEAGEELEASRDGGATWELVPKPWGRFGATPEEKHKEWTSLFNKYQYRRPMLKAEPIWHAVRPKSKRLKRMNEFPSDAWVKAPKLEFVSIVSEAWFRVQGYNVDMDSFFIRDLSIHIENAANSGYILSDRAFGEPISWFTEDV